MAKKYKEHQTGARVNLIDDDFRQTSQPFESEVKSTLIHYINKRKVPFISLRSNLQTDRAKVKRGSKITWWNLHGKTWCGCRRGNDRMNQVTPLNGHCKNKRSKGKRQVAGQMRPKVGARLQIEFDLIFPSLKYQSMGQFASNGI